MSHDPPECSACGLVMYLQYVVREGEFAGDEVWYCPDCNTFEYY